ncbi:hypothetical protein M8J75_000469 [Diaphorina citri]|nr:hypothetical protein M8J75_000469 [Diaphorina citri]
MFKGCSSEDMPAHIYSTAQSIYRSLLSTRRDHSALFLGRSGSGKTTNYQHALRYLAVTAGSVNKILTVDKLSAIWVILEAFGSVRTCLNINATRVSHIFSLDFDQTGLIASASIQLLLLDKHRVVRRPEGESNFHVLYRLLAGADGTLRKELMLDAITNSGEPNQFIIPYSKHEDTQRGLMDFVRLCAAMSTLNITEVELKCIFSMLAAVLHLGAAGAVKGSNSNKWQFQSPAAAQRAAKCLGVGSDQLARVIFSSPIVSPSSGAGGAGSRQYRTPGSPSSSEELNGQEALESFAANLYSEVFNSVGALINRSLAPSTHTVCSLLLVDTPGFQNPASTGHNQSGASFADFCFNYLQERLGLLFHHSVLVAPRDLYSQENIDIPGLNTPDEAEDDFYSPQSLVSLLDNAPSLSYSGATSTTNDNRKPPGLLWLLDELPGASSGASFPDLLFGNFSEKEYHGLLRKAPGQNHFIVQHNLGTNPVLYNTESWPRVTREPTTSRSVVSLLTESTTPGLSNLVSTHRSAGLGSATFDMGGGGRGVASIRRTTTSLHKRRSVPLQVKFTVDSLIETIRRSELRFVHCLLPHHNAGLVDPRSAGQNSHQFDSLVNIPLLRSQLRGSQLLAAVRLYKQGYPRCMPLTEFRRRFALLGAAPGSSTQPAPSEKGSVVSDDKGAVEEILLSLDLDHSSYRVGLSQQCHLGPCTRKTSDARSPMALSWDNTCVIILCTYIEYNVEPSTCQYDERSKVKLQSISDLVEDGYELRIARLETLPIRPNDCKGIKVAKVIRTQNVLGKKSGNIDENGHSPVGSEESFSETINQNKRISSDMDEGNLVPNFIIGDMLYNYDLSHKDTSIVYEESNCVDTTSETTETNDPIDDEDIPYLDLNELKRKKRRKRNKCMEIFNVPMEALNRIEEEDGQPGVSSRDRNDLVVLKTEASDEHVPSLELVNLDSDRNQVLSGFNETRPHSVAPNSIDFQFSWVFNQQFTMDAVHGPSHSFPSVYITNDLHENGLSYEKTFDSFNKPLKRDADSLTISKAGELSFDVKGEKSIESESKSKMVLKKNKMIDIKSKLKEVKIEKPLLLNGKMPSEMKRDVNDVKAEDNVDRRKEYSDLQNGFLSGTSSIPKISFSDTTIDECCTTDTHQQCSLLNNPKVEEPQNSHVIAPDHFHLRNDTEMPNITLNLAEPSDKHFEQNDLVAIAETSPCYFSLKNDKVMNFSHCQKSITDLDYLIGSFQYDPHVDTTPPREPQLNSLSYLPAANNDLTNNAGENSLMVSLEENALRSLDELCTKSLESISEPLSITSTKSKKVTFLEDLDKTNTVDPLAESPVEQTVNSILDDECDKESDTLVEDDVMSLSSSTSSLTSSSSESSGQSMIFNGIPANTETSTQETEIAPKIDVTILKHTSVVTALNQHNFHTYLSPIKELSLEINIEETELQNEQPEISNKEFVDTRSWSRLEGNARDMKMDECVTSFCNDSFMEENRASPDEEVRLVVAKVEEVKSEKWQPIRVDAVSNTDHVRSSDNIGDCTSEVPIKPVVLNTKFIMADLTNQSKNASVSKQSNVKESDGLENCSDRCKTNSSASDLSSELEHILSSIEYESSQPSHSHLNQHTSSESNCSSQSVSSNENDSQDVFHKERRYTKVKPTGSSYLSLKKYALSNVPKKLTEETLSNDKDGCSKYRQIVFEKIKNFENITCPKDESDGYKTTKPSKLPEPKIKAHLSQKVTSSGYSETPPHKVAQVSGSSRFEGARKIVQVPKVSDKVKNFEKKILERENSKSPSPEPSDFKNLFTEKLSNFENMAKKFTNGSAFKNGNGIDLKVNKSISEKLQSFESMSSSSRESSTSPDFTQGKVETKTKSSNEHFKPKIPLKSLRSSFEEKLRNCQLLSDNSSKEVPKPPSPKTTKNQIDVLKKISTFESQIKTENEPQKKDSALSKIPKKKTKSLESIFSSQQAKAKSDRSSSHENILQRDSTSSKVQVPMESSHKVQVQSELSECNKSPSKLKYSPPLSTIQLVSSPTNFVKGSVGQLSSKISGEEMKERVGVERKQEGDLTGKLELGNFSKPSQGYGAGDFPNQTRVTTSPPKSVDQFDKKAALSEEDKELPIMTHQPEPHEKKFKDIMNDSGITEDFEDGLKINTSQDHIKEMLTSIEAIEKLVVPNVSRVCQRLSSPVPEKMNQCHTTQSHVQDVAVRCIQRNVRKFMDVRDWSWWRLYLKINPLLNVHRTDQELQAKSEELEALKSKLEKLEVERNLLKQDNTRLETKDEVFSYAREVRSWHLV